MLRALMLVALLAAMAFAQDVAPPATYEGRKASEWLEMLASEETGERKEAAYALFKLAPDLDGAAKPLARALRDDDRYVRSVAARALVKMGERATEACAEIATSLFSERQEVRREAVTLLYRMGPSAAPAVPDLIHALRSEDAVVRANAAAALGRVGAAAAKPAVPALVKALGDDDAETRKWALSALLIVAPVRAIGHEDAAIRLEAVTAYANHAGKGPAEVKQLLANLAHEDAGIRQWSAAGLNAPFVMTDDVDRTALVAGLVAALREEPDASARVQLAQAVAFQREFSAEAVAAMAAVLAKASGDELVSLVQTAGWYRDAGLPLLPSVLSHATSEDARLRASVCGTAGAIGAGDERALAALVNCLGDDVPSVRAAAAGGIGQMKEQAATALPAVLAALAKDEEEEEEKERNKEEERATAYLVRALGDLGRDTEEVRAVLEPRFDDETRRDRHVAYALARLGGPKSRAALDWLVAEMLVGPRSNVIMDLNRLGEHALGALPQLLEALETRAPRRRAAAASALGALGHLDRERVTTALEAHTDDADEGVRGAVSRSLQLIARSK